MREILPLAWHPSETAKVSFRRGLDQSAVNASKKWWFTPAERDGKPISCWIRFPIHFSLDNSDERLVVPSDEPPKVIYRVEPEYPDYAREASIEGVVMLEVEVLANGTVGTVEVVRSLEEGLDQSAVNAVKKWRFTPAESDGNPIDVFVTIPILFSSD